MGRGNRSFQRKTCAIAFDFTANPMLACARVDADH
jgi:hypothetical protein